MKRKKIKLSGAKVGLNNQQEMFISRYLANGCRNAKEAYIWAGYKGRDNVAEAAVVQLMKRPHVKAEIARLVKVVTKPNRATTRRIIKELCRIAFLNPKDFYNDDGTLKLISELDDDVARAISSIKTNETVISEDEKTSKKISVVTTDIKSCDKLGALTLLMRYKGMLVDKVDHTVKVSGGVLLVPAPVPIDEWEKWAIAEQQKLLVDGGDNEDEDNIIDIGDEDEEEYEEEYE